MPELEIRKLKCKDGQSLVQKVPKKQDLFIPSDGNTAQWEEDGLKSLRDVDLNLGSTTTLSFVFLTYELKELQIQCITSLCKLCKVSVPEPLRL